MNLTVPEVVSIHIARKESGPTEELSEAVLVAGKGIEGDRYFGKKDRDDREITLIEEEAVAAAKKDYDVDFVPGETRRNVMVRNVALNHLVGRRFKVGDCVLEGVKLCEPCSHLKKLTNKTVRGLVHRGGLRAKIIEGGTLRRGDRIDIT